MNANPILVSVIVSIILGILSYAFHKQAKKTPTDDKTFGSFNWVFTVLFTVLVVFLCFAVKPVRDGLSHWVDSGLSSFTPPKEDPPQTLGDPLDYVTWEGNTLKRTTKELPKGWRVAYTLDPNVAGHIVANDMPRTLDNSVFQLYVYLDPDTKVHPTFRSTSPHRLLRPMPKK